MIVEYEADGAPVSTAPLAHPDTAAADHLAWPSYILDDGSVGSSHSYSATDVGTVLASGSRVPKARTQGVVLLKLAAISSGLSPASRCRTASAHNSFSDSGALHSNRARNPDWNTSTISWRPSINIGHPEIASI